MKRAKLIVASSESCADMLYASGFRAPDAFAWVGHNGRQHLLLNDLEIDRGRREAPHARVASYSDIEKVLQGRARKRPPYARVLGAFLTGIGVDGVLVPREFPLGLARDLKKEGIDTRPCEGPFLPARAIKTPRELVALRAAAAVAEAGMARAIETLAAAKILRRGELRWRGRVLTSEVLRTEIQLAVVRAGGETRGDEIVACGNAACDPHARGSGPLRARELIIIDIFPRHAASGFFGDITRTVVRGRASEAQRALWETCLEGQRRALGAIRAGTDGRAIQEDVRAFFRSAGFPEGIHEGRWRGFFHGLGHGLGLEVHEEPRVGSTVLAAGHCVTIEPGLYWPGVGGVRHEDVVVVTERGKSLLTRFPKVLEIGS